ncbi:MAG: hypothetical protein RSB61_04855 [Clostridia bacterium]
MPIKNATGVMLSRFAVSYKILLALLIIILLFSAIGFSIIYPVSHDISSEIHDLHLITATKEYVKELFRGGLITDGADVSSSLKFQELEAKFMSIGDIINRNMSNFVVSIIIAIVLVFAFSICSNAIRVPTASILNTFMCSNGEYGFCASFVANIKKSAAFGSISFLISLAYYAVGLTVGLLVAWGIFLLNKLFGLMFGVFIIVFLFALKKAVFLLWLPAMVSDGLSATHSLAYCWKHGKETFVEALGAYVALSIVGLSALVLIGITTFGVGVFFLIAVLKLFMQSYDLVMYYRLRNYNFYVDDQKVISPNKHYRDAVIDNPLNLEETK